MATEEPEQQRITPTMRALVVEELTDQMHKAISEYNETLTSPITGLEIGQACLAIMFNLGYNIRVKQELREKNQSRGLMRGSEIGA